MKKLYEKVRLAVNKAEKILIISHRKPDSDTLGSALCLKIWLEKEGKDVTLACCDKPSGAFSFMPGIDSFTDEFSPADFDLMIIVDVGASHMTNFHLKYADIFECGVPVVNIDHHASNDNYGNINIVDPTASSTTLILYRMLKYFGVNFDSKMATCLLTGIYGDTGSFMHSNTNKEVFEAAAELMKSGACVAKISGALFNTNTVPALRLWGRVFENSYITADDVVMSVIKDADYDEVGAGPENLSGVVDYLSMVPGVKFAALINEDRKGNLKGSLRTRHAGVDVSRIASVFGGGGHSKASGFIVKGKLSL
ncbi:MAG: bifunctional oligoribonuclease/PAP phosphatase NrnA [Candidatus Peregrinibacteria bacterium]